MPTCHKTVVMRLTLSENQLNLDWTTYDPGKKKKKQNKKMRIYVLLQLTLVPYQIDVHVPD